MEALRRIAGTQWENTTARLEAHGAATQSGQKRKARPLGRPRGVARAEHENHEDAWDGGASKRPRAGPRSRPRTSGKAAAARRRAFEEDDELEDFRSRHVDRVEREERQGVKEVGANATSGADGGGSQAGQDPDAAMRHTGRARRQAAAAVGLVPDWTELVDWQGLEGSDVD